MPLAEKDAARVLVRRYLDNYKQRNKEVLVRINGLDTKWALDAIRHRPPGQGRLRGLGPLACTLSGCPSTCRVGTELGIHPAGAWLVR